MSPWRLIGCGVALIGIVVVAAGAALVWAIVVSLLGSSARAPDGASVRNLSSEPIEILYQAAEDGEGRNVGREPEVIGVGTGGGIHLPVKMYEPQVSDDPDEPTACLRGSIVARGIESGAQLGVINPPVCFNPGPEVTWYVCDLDPDPDQCGFGLDPERNLELRGDPRFDD